MKYLVWILLICFFVSCAPMNSRVNLYSRSYQTLKWENIERQEFDYSCGAAALATILNHYLGDNISEKSILTSLLEHTSLNKLEEKHYKGFSMLDLKLEAERRGYLATGVFLDLEHLKKLRGPIIIVIETKVYFHFVVLKEVINDMVFIADSSRGNIIIPLYKLVELWGGSALIIGKEDIGLIEKHNLKTENIKNVSPTNNIIKKLLLK